MKWIFPPPENVSDFANAAVQCRSVHSGPHCWGYPWSALHHPGVKTPDKTPQRLKEILIHPTNTTLIISIRERTRLVFGIGYNVCIFFLCYFYFAFKEWSVWANPWGKILIMQQHHGAFNVSFLNEKNSGQALGISSKQFPSCRKLPHLDLTYF